MVSTGADEPTPLQEFGFQQMYDFYACVMLPGQLEAHLWDNPAQVVTDANVQTDDNGRGGNVDSAVRPRLSTTGFR